MYNASYFRFMERARTEWLRAQGIDHDELREEHGVVLVLASIEARFRAPARLSDMLYVSASVAEAHGARMRFAQNVRRAEPDGEVVCEGFAEVACMDARRRPAPAFSAQRSDERVELNEQRFVDHPAGSRREPVRAEPSWCCCCIASISSWAVIIDKRRLLKQAIAAAQEFETSFWSGGDLNSCIATWRAPKRRR